MSLVVSLTESSVLPRISALVFLAGMAFYGEPHTAKAAERVLSSAKFGVPRIIISTDVATGLIDTHGGKGLTPTADAGAAPQDIDDGLTLAMALNLEAAGLIELLAIVPTYGNATLPAEMLVAQQITRVLKGRTDIPIAPGAVGPAAQVLNPTPTWFDARP